MAKNKFPKEVRWKINSLAFRHTRHLYPHHQEEYEKQKKIITGHFSQLILDGVPVSEALDLLTDSNQKLMDKLSEVMKKLQNTK